MESEPIFKKTMMTMGAMVGACVVFVGTLSIVAVTITSHVVNPGGTKDEPVLVPADKVPGAAGQTGSKPAVPPQLSAPARSQQSI